MNQQNRSALICRIAGGLALLIAIAVAAAAQNLPKSAPGDAEKGKDLYTRDGCYECHGRAGQGSILTGPRLGPEPIPISGFMSYARQPRGQMPPYTRKVMSDHDLADIYAFLQSLPKPVEAEQIPILPPAKK